jgi:hypothetical protein
VGGEGWEGRVGGEGEGGKGRGGRGGREGEGGKGREGRGGGKGEGGKGTGGMPAASAGLDATSELQLQEGKYATALNLLTVTTVLRFYNLLTVTEALSLGVEIAVQCCVGLGCAFDAFKD